MIVACLVGAESGGLLIFWVFFGEEFEGTDGRWGSGIFMEGQVCSGQEFGEESRRQVGADRTELGEISLGHCGNWGVQEGGWGVWFSKGRKSKE